MELGEFDNKSLDGKVRERVRQIKDKAITKLRSTSRSTHLKSYMG